MQTNKIFLTDITSVSLRAYEESQVISSRLPVSLKSHHVFYDKNNPQRQKKDRN